MTDRLELRTLRQDEYAAWHDLEIEEYAHDILPPTAPGVEASRA